MLNILNNNSIRFSFSVGGHLTPCESAVPLLISSIQIGCILLKLSKWKL